MARVKGKTASGFEYEIDARIRSDRKTLRVLKSLFSDNEAERTIAAYDFAPTILGDDQAADLEEHFRTLNDGFCDENAMEVEVMEIFKGTTDYSGNESKDAKN